jgi:chromosome segregation ATPase
MKRGLSPFPLDFMSASLSASSEASETVEIVGFLQRFADLMSTGSNCENLLRAARLLESHVDLAKESSEQLQVERVRSDANAEARKALEEKIAGLDGETAALKLQLSDQEAKLNEIVAEAARRQGDLIRRAEEAETKLAALQAEVARNTPSDTHILVPVTTVRLAKAQFESLAHAFEKSGNIVSQVRCEASASSLDRAIVDAGVAEVAGRSKHAA